MLSNAIMSRSSNVVKYNNVEDVNLCQMQQCRRCQSLSNATMSKMSIFVKCKVITKSPNHPFLPHFLIFFNKGQETHNPQSAASTPSYTATPKYRNIAYSRHHTATSPIAAAKTAYRRRNIAYRCRKPRRPRRNIASRRRKHRLSPPQTPPPPAATSPPSADVGSYLV